MRSKFILIFDLIKQKYKELSILQWIMLFLFFVYLFLPDDVFMLTAIYNIKQPDYFNYRLFTDNPISIIYLIFILLAFIILIRNKSLLKQFKYLLVVFFGIILKDLILIIFTDNPFIMSGYLELYFKTIVSFSILTIVLNFENKDKYFLNVFFISTLLGIILAIYLSANKIVGRFNAPNLDVNETGFVLGLFSIYLLAKININKYLKLIIIPVIFVFQFFTGSRGSVASSFFCIFIYIIIKYRKNYIILASLAIFAIILGLFLYQNPLSINFGPFNRMYDSFITIIKEPKILFTSQEYFGGRYDSILAGIKALKIHPYGISYSVFDLMNVMNQLNYPTFPHSTPLSFYLVGGPALLIFFFFFIKNMILLAKHHNKLFFVLLYILLFDLFFGGMFLTEKSFFIRLYLFIMSFNYRE